jgi:hypothetical protein
MNGLLAGWQSIAIKEMRHIQRDRVTLVFAILMPLIQLLLFGFAIDYDIRYVRTVIVDQDRSRESRAYVDSGTPTISTPHLPARLRRRPPATSRAGPRGSRSSFRPTSPAASAPPPHLRYGS